VAKKTHPREAIAWERGAAVKSMADETVNGEPVSRRSSLLTGKITGNFTKIGPFGETLPVRTQQNQLVAGQFPTKWNRELIRAEQGIY